MAIADQSRVSVGFRILGGLVGVLAALISAFVWWMWLSRDTPAGFGFLHLVILFLVPVIAVLFLFAAIVGRSPIPGDTSQ